MKQFTTSARLFVVAAVCSACVLPVVAQAQTSSKATAKATAKAEKSAVKAANHDAKMAGKAMHRATTKRDDADKVVDNLTLPEKKVFHGMSEAEKGVARRMAHIAKQIL